MTTTQSGCGGTPWTKVDDVKYSAFWGVSICTILVVCCFTGAARWCYHKVAFYNFGNH